MDLLLANVADNPAYLRQFVIVDEQRVEVGEAGYLFHGQDPVGNFVAKSGTRL